MFAALRRAAGQVGVCLGPHLAGEGQQPDGSRHPFDQFIIAKTPAGRWGEASDLGGPAVFLASEASDFVNGHILYVDGGILAYIGKQPG